MKKVLFNCSTNIQGGAVQNSANFVLSSQNDQDIEFHYLVSEPVNSIIQHFQKNLRNINLISKSPSRNLKSRSIIKSIENDISPDLVYTMAGPSYVHFDSMHVMGCSNPYIIFASRDDMKFGRSNYEYIKRYLNTFYQKFYINNADYFIFQTRSSAENFAQRFKITNEKYSYIPNSIGITKQYQNERTFSDDPTLKILCPFENYPHKGIHILPSLVRELDRKSLDFKIISTNEPNKNLKKEILRLGLTDRFEFIGKQRYENMAENYIKSSIVFMPSILEIFSSICIEALYFRKPLVVADRLFNREITEKYAFYCDPYSINSCEEAIMKANEKVHDDEYLDAAKEFIMNKYGEYNDRFNAIRKILIGLIK